MYTRPTTIEDHRHIQRKRTHRRPLPPKNSEPVSPIKTRGRVEIVA